MPNRFKDILFYKAGKFIKSLPGYSYNHTDFSINSNSVLHRDNSIAILPAIIPIIPRTQYTPLSFNQEQLWFLDKLEGSVQYHIPLVLRLQGYIDSGVLKTAIQAIVNRHEILRTVILEDADGRAYQQLSAPDGWTIGYKNAPDYHEDKAALTAYIQEVTNRPFDLRKDCMLRADLIGLGSTENILVFTLHHIAADGLSIPIIINELAEFYTANIEGRQAKLTPLSIQYADYALWQRKYLQGELLNKKIAYWKAKLEGVVQLQLPTDQHRPRVKSVNGATERFFIDKKLSVQLKELSRGQDATLNMTLLSAFKLLMYRYSGQEDICIGVPVAGRSHREVKALVGFFINTLAIRSHINGDMPFTALLAAVKDTMLETYKYQDVPFQKVVEAVVKRRDKISNPLFQVMFVLQDTPVIQALNFGGASLSQESFFNERAKFEITFNLSESEQGIQGNINYNTDLFTGATIQRMASHYVNLLKSIVTLPTQQAGYLPMLSINEESQLLEDFNNLTVEHPEDKTLAALFEEPVSYSDKNIIDLFEEQVLKTPGSIALVYNQTRLTYQELNGRANQLAGYLKAGGYKSESIIPICVSKSIEMIIGILGVLKAGYAYLPIDPEYPAERIKFMLADVQADIVLTSQKDSINIKNLLSEDKILKLDTQWHAIQHYPVKNPNIFITENQLSYVLYTSGSTGKPKGVLVQHNSLAYALLWFNKLNHISSRDSTLLTSSFSFDGSMTSIWPVLLKGGTLHMASYSQFDPEWILDYIASNAITYFKTLPAVFKTIINTNKFKQKNICSTLRLVILGGERIDAADIKKYMGIYPDVSFANSYGPTECTIFSNLHIINKDNIDSFCKQPIIGRPLEGTKIYIVDKNEGLSPLGAPGELYIGGPGLSRGYLNRPELTVERFVSDPFSTEAGLRLYKTGDIGRWLPGGEIEHLGRADDQVKIRGYRIELGEIDDTLGQSGLVKQSAVLARENKDGQKQLVAYVVPAPGFSKQAAVTYLKEQLPEYMVPTVWVPLDSFPLTPNGKVDKKALLKSNYNNIANLAYAASTNDTEQMLVEIWQELLGIKRVGIHDNFFELGGHSLTAIKIITRLTEKTGKKLPVSFLLKYPTICELAIALDDDKNIKWKSLVPVKTSGSKTPLYIVHGMGLAVLIFKNVANHVDTDQPIYGLQGLGMDGNIEDIKTMEENAAIYVSEILAHNPHGPYRLAGYSFGGILAFEMAQQFKAMNKEVEILAIIDTDLEEPLLYNSAPIKMKRFISRLFPRLYHEAICMVKYPAKAIQYQKTCLQLRFGSWAKWIRINKKVTPTGAFLDIEKAKGKYAAALRDYVMKPYNGNIVLFRSKIRMNYLKDFKFLGWKPFINGEIKVYDVPGDHDDMLLPPNDKIFASILQTTIDND